MLILGAANLVGDGFSMAAANFAGTKAEREEYARLRAIEEQHVDLVPEGEREEIRQIYSGKGFSGYDLERAVAVVTADRGRWIDAMMTGSTASRRCCGHLGRLPSALSPPFLPAARSRCFRS